MANNVYGAINLKDSTGALNLIDGINLLAGDIGVVVTDTNSYFYKLFSNDTSEENIPYIIKPILNGANKRWRLTSISETSGDLSVLGKLMVDKITFSGNSLSVVTSGDNALATFNKDTQSVSFKKISSVEDASVVTGLNAEKVGGKSGTLMMLTDGSEVFTAPITGVSPTLDSHLATKLYVDTLINAIDTTSATDFTVSNILTTSIINSPSGSNLYIKNNGNTLATFDGSSVSFNKITSVSDSSMVNGLNAQYIQGQTLAGFMLSDGSVGFSNPVSGKTPTQNAHLATKGYIDTSNSTKASKGANSDITSLSGLIAPLSIEQGGTGRTTGAADVTLSNLTDYNVTANILGYSRRNRICNSDFKIDNVSWGSAVTPTTSQYVVDSGFLQITQPSKITTQRTATAPLSTLSSFPNSLKISVASAYTPLTGDLFTFQKRIEGIDFSDLLWGTTNAIPATISFTIKVNVSGTYSFGIRNAAGTHTYMFTKSLVANTETRIVETVPGCTEGVWPIITTLSTVCIFGLGGGTTYSTSTTNTWLSGNYGHVSGTTQFVANAGATYEISGIQLEKGSFATPFECLSLQQIETWCQRYHPIFRSLSAADILAIGHAYTTTSSLVDIPYYVVPRARPTGIITYNQTSISIACAAQTGPATAIAYNGSGYRSLELAITTVAGSPTLVAGQSVRAYFNNANGYILATGAEL